MNHLKEIKSTFFTTQAIDSPHLSLWKLKIGIKKQTPIIIKICIIFNYKRSIISLLGIYLKLLDHRIWRLKEGFKTPFDTNAGVTVQQQLHNLICASPHLSCTLIFKDSAINHTVLIPMDDHCWFPECIVSHRIGLN